MFEIIRRREWRVVRQPGWAYSSGLWPAYRHPEIAIFGLPPDRWGLVNVVAELVSGGMRLRPGMEIDDVLVGSRVAVRRIDPSWCVRLFRPRMSTAGHSPEYLQIVWPDVDGGFPWESGCHGRPRLWLPVDDHGPGHWSRLGEQRVAGSWRG